MYAASNGIPMGVARGYAGGYVTQPARPTYTYGDGGFPKPVQATTRIAKPVQATTPIAKPLEATTPIAKPVQVTTQTVGEAIPQMVTALGKQVQTLQTQVQTMSSGGINLSDAFTPSIKPLDPSRIRFKQLDEATPMEPIDYFFQTGFKHIMKEQLNVTKNVATEMMAGSDLQVALENLKAEQREKVAIAQRENVAALWEEYDRDKNGVLQPEELGKLIQDLWLVEKKNIAVTTSAILEQSMQMGAQVALNTMKAAGGDNAEEMQDMLSMMSGMMEMQKPMIEQTSLDMMRKREANLAADVQQMLATMDVNHDGVVTRDEFESKFLEAYQKISDQMAMPPMQQMMQAEPEIPRPTPQKMIRKPLPTVLEPQKLAPLAPTLGAPIPRQATVLPSSAYVGNPVMAASSAAPFSPSIYNNPIRGAQYMYGR